MRNLCEHAFCGDLVERLDDEEELAAHRAQSADYQRGYEVGRDDSYRALAQRDESSVPPLLRRFFWRGLDGFCEDSVPLLWVSPKEAGHDEWCNPVVGIRLKGGVLYIRYGRYIRLPMDGYCPTCRNEMELDHEESQA